MLFRSRVGSLPTDYDSAFREMMAQPTDLDLTFRFAELAIVAGDLEGAVSAFERLLIFNPDLPRIRFVMDPLKPVFQGPRRSRESRAASGFRPGRPPAPKDGGRSSMRPVSGRPRPVPP